ncbi:MAG: hypoxanthine phosphoribosyltransferase [Acidimicrobiales bacterium]
MNDRPGPARPRVVVPAEQVEATVRRLAAELSAAYGDGLLLVAVLKGSLPFIADLVRALTINPEVAFLAISSYAPDSGRVRIVLDLQIDIDGRDVVLVEDIVDTGLTLTYLLDELRRRGPRSLEACAFLDKSVRRIVPTPVRFVGVEIADDFVLGYGLDYAGRYRNLNMVVAGDLAALRADPDAHVEALYSL